MSGDRDYIKPGYDFNYKDFSVSPFDGVSEEHYKFDWPSFDEYGNEVFNLGNSQVEKYAIQKDGRLYLTDKKWGSFLHPAEGGAGKVRYGDSEFINPVQYTFQDLESEVWFNKIKDVRTSDYLDTIYDIAKDEHGEEHANYLRDNAFPSLFTAYGDNMGDVFKNLMEQNHLIIFSSDEGFAKKPRTIGRHRPWNPHTHGGVNLKTISNTPEFLGPTSQLTTDRFIPPPSPSDGIGPDTIFVKSDELNPNLLMHELFHRAFPHNIYQGEPAAESVHPTIDDMYISQNTSLDNLIYGPQNIETINLNNIDWSK